MSVLWKNIEFKGRSNCEVILIVAWVLEQSAGGFSGG